MTTAHKPTFHPAMGSEFQGGYRFYANRLQFSSQDMPSHKKLKFRQPGQNAPEDLKHKDFLKELKSKESAHLTQLKIQSGADPQYNEPDNDPTENNLQLQSSNDILQQLEQFDDSDESYEGDTDSNESDDEEKELLAELKKIKEERKQEMEEHKETNESQKVEKINSAIRENPLLLEDGDFEVKERWDHDIVFRNQAKEEKPQVARFINDTIRNDFHRKFMKRYIR